MNSFEEDKTILKMCDVIRESSLSLHAYLRHGHLEKVYENGLENRLSKMGLFVQTQFPLPVLDEDGTVLGDYFADLLVNQDIILEIKACKNLNDEHVAQILGYLRASRKRHGLLINFGAPKLQIQKLVL